IPTPYDAGNSNASNAAPTSKALVDAVTQRVADLKQENPDAKGPVPVDLVTTSASGLDPDISPAAATYQVPRVAKARGVVPEDVEKVVAANTKGRTLGIFGERRVNVLRLNLALDQLQKKAQ